MKIKISQAVPGYNPEFWGFSLTHKDQSFGDGGHSSRSLAIESATEEAAKILTAEGWDEEEIEQKITEALAE